jgi:hypothetical protein
MKGILQPRRDLPKTDDRFAQYENNLYEIVATIQGMHVSTHQRDMVLLVTPDYQARQTNMYIDCMLFTPFIGSIMSEHIKNELPLTTVCTQENLGTTDAIKIWRICKILYKDEWLHIV